MKYSVIVDGPNLICEMIREGIAPEAIAAEFSLGEYRALASFIRTCMQGQIEQLIVDMGVEFYCSRKLPGPEKKKLTTTQWNQVLERLQKEDAVVVHQLQIEGQSEKGVDVAVATRLIEVAEICDVVCLVASDKDYIPVLEYLKRKGKFIVTMGIEKRHPIELRNLSYMYRDISEYLHSFQAQYDQRKKK